jgi:hypothetical protein
MIYPHAKKRCTRCASAERRVTWAAWEQVRRAARQQLIPVKRLLMPRPAAARQRARVPVWQRVLEKRAEWSLQLAGMLLRR